MNEKTETTTPWPFAPGQIVRDSGEGDDTVWLDAAPVGTVVQNAEGCEWTRGVHGWFGAHPSRATSADLVELGPLTVVSVPDCCDHLDMEQGHCYACYDSGHAHDPERPCPPAATLQACTVDETAGGAETTGAVERATAAIRTAALGTSGAHVMARAALAAALDVDEMARVLIDHTRIDGIHGDCSCGHVVPLGRSFAAHQAAAYRAAIVGPDLEAPASTATDAVQERPEPQTARSASDGSQAVHGAPAISLGDRLRDAIQTWRSQTSEPDPANDEVIEVGGYSFWRLVQEVGDLADEADETEYQLDRTRAAHERDVQNLGQANTRLSGEVDRLKAALLPDGAIDVHEECNREIAELEAALQRVREIVPTLRKIWAGGGKDVGEVIDAVEELVGQALDGGTGAER